MIGLKWNGICMSVLSTYQLIDGTWRVHYLDTQVHKGGY